MTGLTTAIPFFLVSLTVFFRGAVFLLFCGPLVYEFSRSNVFFGGRALLHKGIIANWINVVTTSEFVTLVPAFIMVSIVLGFALAPVDAFFSSLFALPFERGNAFRSQGRPLKLFSPFQYRRESYIKLLDWLSENPKRKSQWELQMFSFHLRWSFAANLVVFLLLSWPLLSGYWSLGALAGFVVGPSLVILPIAFYHSFHMGRVHRYMLDDMEPKVSKVDETGIDKTGLSDGDDT